jgi:hypothetical protein
MKTCCQCPSPARAELDGRFYCFTHVPLMTDWWPVEFERRPIVTIAGIDKLQKAVQSLQHDAPGAVTKVLRRVAKDYRNKLANKEASS